MVVDVDDDDDGNRGKNMGKLKDEKKFFFNTTTKFLSTKKINDEKIL